MQIKPLFILLLSYLMIGNLYAQLDSSQSIQKVPSKFEAEKDFADILRGSSKKDKHKVLHPNDTTENKSKKQFSVIPAAGYSLQTGLAGILSANLAYFNDTAATQKMSSISASVTYTEYDQILAPLTINIWTKTISTILFQIIVISIIPPIFMDWAEELTPIEVTK